MTTFISKNWFEEIFNVIWQKMIDETDFGPVIREGNISIYFSVDEPDLSMFVDENGPVFGDDASSRVPLITMKMSGDDFHKLWLHQLDVLEAVAQSQIKARGPVEKILQIVPLLEPGQKIYSSYCKNHNLEP